MFATAGSTLSDAQIPMLHTEEEAKGKRIKAEITLNCMLSELQSIILSYHCRDDLSLKCIEYRGNEFI